ncbi:MAG: hypothetical protein ACNS60_14865 [Candidatus Cyclobacteriaceae bacterium M2_1C_046]
MTRGCILLLLLTIGFYAQADIKPINPTDSTALEDAIHSKLAFILESGNTTDNLSEEDLANLPIGIKKEIGSITYHIIIDSVRFTPNAAYLNAYASLEFTESQQRLAFAATNIKFQPGGLAATMSSKLRLVSPKRIDIGSNIDLILAADGQNYVEFDCNGFKSINVKGLFEFSEEILLPADDNQGKVTAVFEGNFTDLNNIIASVSIEPFRPMKFQEITVRVSEAIIDLSDLRNPASVQFPNGYHSATDADMFWSGFYLKHARISLPNKLNDKSEDIHIDAQHLIIDKKGFSGNIGVANLFAKEDGSLNGWPFSIDSLGIHMVKNQLKGAAFKGQLAVPPFDKETPLDYYALIQKQGDSTNYQFNLKTTEEIKASVLMANIELDPGSSITIIEKEGKFKPEAYLHGSISVKSGNKLELKKLRFEKLHLASEKPYIRSGVWSMTGEGNQTAGKFPISISQVQLTHSDDQMKLSLNIALNLMNSEDKGFSANSTVAVLAALEEEAIQHGEEIIYEQKWEYKKTIVSSIALKVVTKAFKLDGQLKFYEDDNTYGNGFRGDVKAVFADFNIEAVGQFGKVSGYRYWYVDALVRLPTPIGTGFGLYGMGGGLSYHMEKQENFFTEVNEFSDQSGANDEASIGASRSSTVYKPNKDIGIGFKASVIVGIIPKPDPFNGVVTFEMEFFAGGGIRHIRFIGDAYFMKPMDETDASKAQMHANVRIQMDFENDVLHGELVTFVNVQDAIKGIHENNKAGLAVIHIDKNDWYLHVGTPGQRIGLNFIGLVEANSYFMLGTYLHDFPSVTDVIPSNLVEEIQDDLDGFMRDENALATGGGIAFGASLTVSTGRQQVLIFYGQFDAGFGFDIMLRDYGDVRCEGEAEPIGINGWYASGQSWIYIQGEIGISVKLKFIEGDFVIAGIGMASVVQAKLPNPLYLQGFVEGQYNILGGLVKGNFNFKFTVGEECTLVGDDATSLGIKVIAEMQPQSTEEVDVFTAPQVAFNVPVDQVFELMDDEDGSLDAYKVELDHFKIKKGNDEVVGLLEWSEDRQTVIFNSHEILPPNSTLTAQVKVSWYERVKGAWKALGGSTPEYEEEEITFDTGEAPDYIPESNVLYSYPVTGMYHFYPEEHTEGYMVLKKGQSYLFENTDEFNFETRMVPVGSMDGFNADLTYTESSKEITYSLPAGLKNEQAYSILFVKEPVNILIIDENVSSVTAMAEESEIGTAELETKDIEGVAVLQEEELLYESRFRTSMYNTFLDKLNALNGMSTTKDVTSSRLQVLGFLANAAEVFDQIETDGADNIEPLVQFEAKTENVWYKDHIYPLNYELYPVNQFMPLTWREAAPVGIPPLRAIEIEQQNNPPLLSASDMFSGNDHRVGGYFLFNYELSFYAYFDFKNLQNRAYNLYIDYPSTAPTGAKRLLNSNYTNIKLGDYKFDVKYVLPGTDIITTTKTLTITR